MDCVNWHERVSAFLDGELDTNDQVDLFKHLAGCPACHLFLDSMLKWKEMNRREAISFPADLDEAILNAIDSRNPDQRRVGMRTQRPPSFWRRKIALSVPVFLFAVAVFLIAITFMVGSIVPSPGRDDQLLRAIAAGSHAPSQPAAIIFLYGLPEVQVVGDPSSNQRIEKTIY